MAERRHETPVDPLTMQALPIYFTRQQYEDALPDVHQHHAEHSTVNPALKEVTGELARRSRIYMTPDYLHLFRFINGQYNPGGYHNVFFGPYVPSEPEKKIIIANANFSRIVPRTALELDGLGGYDLRDLTDKEHAFLSDPLIARIEDQHRNALRIWRQRINLGHKIVDVALSLGIDDLLSRRELIRLRDSKDYAVTQELGDLAIFRAVEDMVRPTESIFDMAIEQGMVSKEAPRPTEAVTAFLPRHQFRRHYEQVLELFSIPDREPKTTLQTGVDAVALEAA